MREHELNKLNNFIMGWYSDDDIAICDQLIDYWKQDVNKKDGITGHNYVDKNCKDSTDSVLPSSQRLWDYYLSYLQCRVDKYIETYPYCDAGDPWTIIQNVSIQYYKPGGGFYQWHTERASSSFPFSSRHLVFMTYLNDVPVGGETEFFHQGLKIKPEKGLTLIWPADWTFTHRGITSLSHEKYIATGWYSYYKRNTDENINTREWRVPSIR